MQNLLKKVLKAKKISKNILAAKLKISPSYAYFKVNCRQFFEEELDPISKLLKCDNADVVSLIQNDFRTYRKILKLNKYDHN
jgi:hypothetical protein